MDSTAPAEAGLEKEQGMWGIYALTEYNEKDILVQVVVGTYQDAKDICNGWNAAVSDKNYYVDEITL